MAVGDVKRSTLIDLLDTVRPKASCTASILLTDLPEQMFRFAHARPGDAPAGRGQQARCRRHALRARPRRRRTEVRMLDKALPPPVCSRGFVSAVWIILTPRACVGELRGRPGPKPGRIEARGPTRATSSWATSTLRARPPGGNQEPARPHDPPQRLLCTDAFQKLYELPRGRAWRLFRRWPGCFPNTALTGPVGSKSLGKQLSDRQRRPSRRCRGSQWGHLCPRPAGWAVDCA